MKHTVPTGQASSSFAAEIAGGRSGTSLRFGKDDFHIVPDQIRKDRIKE